MRLNVMLDIVVVDSMFFYVLSDFAISANACPICLWSQPNYWLDPNMKEKLSYSITNDLDIEQVKKEFKVYRILHSEWVREQFPVQTPELHPCNHICSTASLM